MKKTQPSIAIANGSFDSGYEALNDFESSFKEFTSDTLIDGDGRAVILVSRLATPIGSMFICATEQGICLLEFEDRKDIQGQFKRLETLLNGIIFKGENSHIITAQQQLKEYFLGQRCTFELSLFIQGTRFQQQVWACLIQIEYGETSSYQ